MKLKYCVQTFAWRKECSTEKCILSFAPFAQNKDTSCTLQICTGPRMTRTSVIMNFLNFVSTNSEVRVQPLSLFRIFVFYPAFFQSNSTSVCCTGQLEVSYVIPVLFLSNSLGTLLPPRTVEQQDFEMALKNVDSPESKSLLDKWYTLDSHAQPPCYQLRPISIHIPNIDVSHLH